MREQLKMRNRYDRINITFILSNYNNFTKLPSVTQKHFDFKNHKLLYKELTDINNIILINTLKILNTLCNEILYILKN